MTLLSRTFDHYRAFHEFGPVRLRHVGFGGLFIFLAMYLVRFMRPDPRVFDDVPYRLVAIAMFTALSLEAYWPRRIADYAVAFSWATLAYSLPFFTVFLALERGGGVPAISNIFIGLSFLVLLSDWRNTLAMLLVGVTAALALHQFLSPGARIPADLAAQLPAFIALVLGGNFFKYSSERVQAAEHLRTAQSLAGSIAHEVRNPLAQVKHSLAVLRRLLPRATPPVYTPQHMRELHRAIGEGELAVRRGLQLIAMTLDEVFAKPPELRRFQRLSAAALVRKAVNAYGYESEEARTRVAVRVNGNFHFRADETSMLFTLFNLIRNALYYLPLRPNAQVTITVQRPVILVHDNGPGIAPHLRARLFEPLQSAGKTGGTGLGLAYCRRTMRGLGGEITCDSVHHRYTQFTLSFPVMDGRVPLEPTTPERPPVPLAARCLAGRVLLLVDDSGHSRLAVATALREAGAEVVEASHGQAALEQIALRPYWDAVLMDIDMPGMNGLEAAQRIRQGQSPHRGVPILALTAHSDPFMVESARRAGMDDLLVKPAETDEVLRKLLAHMSIPPADAPSISPEHALPLAPPAIPTQPPAEGPGAVVRGAGSRASGVLNELRLQEYVRLGLLEEFMDDYLPQLGVLVGRVRERMEARDARRSLEAMHQLLGLSGDAGAAALNRHVRPLYTQLLGGADWSVVPEGWGEELEQLAAQSEALLRDFVRRSVRV